MTADVTIILSQVTHRRTESYNQDFLRCTGRSHRKSHFLSVPALKNLLTGDVPPNKVCEKNLDSIANYNVLQRDDSMVLYSPPISTDNSKKAMPYEIVLFRPASESVNSSYRWVFFQRTLLMSDNTRSQSLSSADTGRSAAEVRGVRTPSSKFCSNSSRVLQHSW